jgi:hypothetical protein
MVITRKTAYGPSLRPKTSRTLRRLAWAMGLHMSTTLEEIIKIIPHLINSKVVCSACRDRSRCCDCYFKPNNKPALPKSKLTAHLQKYFTPGKKLTLNKKYLSRK